MFTLDSEPAGHARHPATAAGLLLAYSGAQLAELVLAHSQITHTFDLSGHVVPGRLEGLRAAFDAAVTVAQRPPAVEPAALARSTWCVEDFGSARAAPSCTAR